MASKQIVLITGGNTGIGFETVKALLRSDRTYHILLAGRDVEKAQTAAKDVVIEIPSSSSTVEPIQIDIEDDASITKAFEEVSSKHDRIDCLINNAGASFDSQIISGQLTTRQAFTKNWDVNVTGSHIVTETFLPLLLKSNDARLIFVTSGLSSLEIVSDTTHGSYRIPPAGAPKPAGTVSYKAAKAALNLLMIEWNRMLTSDGVKVWGVAPGMLTTNLGGHPEFLKKMGARDPSVGGAVLRNVVEGKRDGEVGRVVREYDSPLLPW